MQDQVDLKILQDMVDCQGIPAPAPKQSTSQVYVIAARWTVDHTDENKTSLCSWLTQNAKKWMFQSELGEETKRQHYQIFMNLKVKQYAKNLAIHLNDLFRGIECQPCSDAGKEALKKYCMKDDTRYAGPWADHPIYLGQDLPTYLYPWQQTLLSIVLSPPNNRQVIYVCDSLGNQGKSIFTKLLGFKYDCVPLAYGNSKDLLNLISKMLGRRAYIFDLTRAKPSDHSLNDIYSTIEQVKGGTIINTKYETSIQYMMSPHVIVFANFLPQQNKLSLDRWKFFSIDESKNLKNL